MTRSILSVIASLLVWIAVASLAHRALGAAWPAYAAAAPAMAFTLPMLVARLLMGVASTLAAGATVLAAGRRRLLPWVTGCLLLIMFIPTHVQMWQRFPVWYHVVFLGYLLPLALIGGRLVQTRSLVVSEAATPS